ncbi:MAG: tRNA (adenosine(37)-N6)-threonylcarbamoyltransferase complex dimerization subunit type 1 TsaB [Actinomycetota bacterium]
MIIVAIETSTPQTSVAIASEAGLLGRVGVAGKARQEAVTPALEQLLAWSNLDVDQIGGIAVGIGPGLFTGLRVGVETAKTLAQVLGVPILGVCSLDTLASGVRHCQKQIIAVIDGRRGEVFWSAYRPAPSGPVRERDPEVSSPEALAAEIAAMSREVLAVGNGAILYRDALQEVGPQVEFASAIVAHPDAAALAERAIPRFLRGELDRLTDLVPMYLRKSDAEIAWDQRARNVSS